MYFVCDEIKDLFCSFLSGNTGVVLNNCFYSKHCWTMPNYRTNTLWCATHYFVWRL